MPSYSYWSGPAYPTVAPQSSVSVSVAPPPLLPDTGRLRFEVEPADQLQVFVDGAYVGTPDDLRHEVDLQPGSRRIEFRAPGFRTLIIDAQIVTQRTITYRGALNAIDPEPSAVRDTQTASTTPAPLPAGSTTLYVIPGCYLGNVRPQEARLPAGCDISRLSIRTP